MYSLEQLLEKLEDQRFGILAESNTYQLTVVGENIGFVRYEAGRR